MTSVSALETRVMSVIKKSAVLVTVFPGMFVSSASAQERVEWS